ncbi:hypothetical protein [Cupriavidus basilensis]
MDSRQANLAVERADDLLWIMINRAEKANAMTVAIMEGITAAIRAGASDPTVKAVLLTAAGGACSVAARTYASSRKTVTWRVSASAGPMHWQRCRTP